MGDAPPTAVLTVGKVVGVTCGTNAPPADSGACGVCDNCDDGGVA